ncbi:MAG: YceI family protein [Chloroflexota bacterium]|nr:YceI family protein [Chloroflexota bacterium]MDE2942537.1 YceI family protein [Chloroflexota bacterium]MDE3267991.1 YceI family protein [Chloroflexota bacterium]
MRVHTAKLLKASVAATLTVSLLLLVACGSEPDPTPTSPPAPTATHTPSPTATSPATEAGATDAPAATATSPAPAATATDEPVATEPHPTEPAAAPRSTGDYEGYTFVVSEGSEATFTVEEQLASLPLPNDAVMRTTALSGEVHLDGRPSVVEVDLQRLSSDQEFRDRYVRNRMFGQYPVAVFTVEDIGGIPDGLAEGEEVATRVEGSVEVHGGVFPLEFEIQARDDGDSLFILGRTTFTWDQLEVPRPEARSVVSIEDDVRVEILLAVVPQ